jgi:glycosyltransferase involved in cell wall biosynthesis
MQNMLDITINILSYNRPDFLNEALRSVIDQSYTSKRIRIYDNGSEKIVYETIQSNICEAVEWIGSDKNNSFIWNFNRALTDTRSKYVMFLHDDDRLCPRFLDKQIRLMNENPTWVALSCNGYIIERQGHRNKQNVMPININNNIEIYNNSGDVALKYAGSSCLPFSPTIYRTDALMAVALREEFGKVLDAVLFCDLADRGVVACQTIPLYECRVHSGQDSSFFDYSLMIQLDKFYEGRCYSSELVKIKVQKLLSGSHSVRKIKRAIQLLARCDFSGLKILHEETSIDVLNILFLVKIKMTRLFKIDGFIR